MLHHHLTNLEASPLVTRLNLLYNSHSPHTMILYAASDVAFYYRQGTSPWQQPRCPFTWIIMRRRDWLQKLSRNKSRLMKITILFRNQIIFQLCCNLKQSYKIHSYTHLLWYAAFLSVCIICSRMSHLCVLSTVDSIFYFYITYRT